MRCTTAGVTELKADTTKEEAMEEEDAGPTHPSHLGLLREAITAEVFAQRTT